jgi:hypothetical protein
MRGSEIRCDVMTLFERLSLGEKVSIGEEEMWKYGVYGVYGVLREVMSYCMRYEKYVKSTE